MVIYPKYLKNRNLDFAKAPGFNDHNSPHISNIGGVVIVESRELSHESKSDFSGTLGIDVKMKKPEYLVLLLLKRPGVKK